MESTAQLQARSAAVPVINATLIQASQSD